jgi:hypothetical protein
MYIDSSIETSTKVMAVTGGISLYANPPTTVWTVLTAYANSGDTTI